MNELNSAIYILIIGGKHLLILSVPLFLFCINGVIDITYDTYEIYKTVLPFETLWEKMSIIEKTRLISLPFFMIGSIWYFIGVISNIYQLSVIKDTALFYLERNKNRA